MRRTGCLRSSHSVWMGLRRVRWVVSPLHLPDYGLSHELAKLYYEARQKTHSAVVISSRTIMMSRIDLFTEGRYEARGVKKAVGTGYLSG